MALSNSQYNQILREYEMQQADDRAALDARTAEVYEKIPKMRELDARAGRSALSRYRKYMADGDDKDIEEFSSEVDSIKKEREALLVEAGFAPDHMEMHYVCRDCKDTGFIGNEKCHCFRAKEAKLLYAQSRLEHILSKENFDNMSFEFYDDTKIMDRLGMTQAEYMRRVADLCKRFAEDFDENGGNILFTGSTGVGKTFLSGCIAAELMKTYHSVIYLTAIELFDVIAAVKIEKKDDTGIRELYNRIMDCDLLVIDDLGSELSNSMTNSNLFYIINNRLQSDRSTIISTNLSVNVMRDIYSERVTSRLQSEYDIIPIYGEDIRLKKQ